MSISMVSSKFLSMSARLFWSILPSHKSVVAHLRNFLITSVNPFDLFFTILIIYFVYKLAVQISIVYFIQTFEHYALRWSGFILFYESLFVDKK